MDSHSPPSTYDQRMINMETEVSGLRSDLRNFGKRMDALEVVCTPAAMEKAMLSALDRAQISHDAAAYLSWKGRLLDKHTWFIVLGCVFAAKEPRLAELLRSLS